MRCTKENQEAVDLEEACAKPNRDLTDGTLETRH